MANRTISFRLPESAIKEVERIAKERRTTKTAIVVNSIFHYIEKGMPSFYGTPPEIAEDLKGGLAGLQSEVQDLRDRIEKLERNCDGRCEPPDNLYPSQDVDFSIVKISDLEISELA